MRATCITGTNIWTGTDKNADSLILVGNQIVCVGTYSEIKNNPFFRESNRVELKGKTVIPGLSDSHIHLLAYAKQKLFSNLVGLNNKSELLSLLGEKAQTASPTDWVCGFNFNETSWLEPTMPNRHDLDSLRIPNPVLIQRTCTHATVLNSRAMEICNLMGFNWSEGVIKDSSGNPNGIIVEDIQAVAHSRMSNDMYSRDKLLVLLKESIEECASHGLTTIFACGAESLGMPEIMDLYQDLYVAGDLKARVFTYHDIPTNPSITTGFGDRMLGYQGYKIFLDGSLGARTAALSEPYSDATSERGMLLHKTDELAQLLVSLDTINCQSLVHTIGDAALDQLLDALEIARKGDRSGVASLRLPLIVNHCMICRPDQMKRMKHLGVSATIQPTFVQSDRFMAPERLGDRVDKGWAYPWKSLIDVGILINGSSDCPIESLNPWHGISAAVGRRTASAAWMPEQCLSLEEALKIYTVNPAINSGAISWRGTIEKGKEADLAIIDRDIFSCSKDELKDVRTLCTIVGGNVTYGCLGD